MPVQVCAAGEVRPRAVVTTGRDGAMEGAGMMATAGCSSSIANTVPALAVGLWIYGKKRQIGAAWRTENGLFSGSQCAVQLILTQCSGRTA